MLRRESPLGSGCEGGRGPRGADRRCAAGVDVYQDWLRGPHYEGKSEARPLVLGYWVPFTFPYSLTASRMVLTEGPSTDIDCAAGGHCAAHRGGSGGGAAPPRCGAGVLDWFVASAACSEVCRLDTRLTASATTIFKTNQTLLLDRQHIRFCQNIITDDDSALHARAVNSAVIIIKTVAQTFVASMHVCSLSALPRGFI